MHWSLLSASSFDPNPRLPLSDGRSWAMLRMYGPSPEAVAGGYQPPPIVKVKQDSQQVQSG